MNDILDTLNFMKPTYLVKTDKDIYRIQASTCSIDTDLKIICFYNKGSVQAMPMYLERIWTTPERYQQFRNFL